MWMALQVTLRSAHNALLLAPVDGDRRPTKIMVATRLDLDEDQALLVEGNDVNFAGFGAVIPRQYLLPPGVQPVHRLCLVAFA